MVIKFVFGILLLAFGIGLFASPFSNGATYLVGLILIGGGIFLIVRAFTGKRIQ